MFDLIAAFLMLAAMAIGFFAMIAQWPLAAAYGWDATTVKTVEMVERLCGAFLLAMFGCMLAKAAFLWGLANTPVLMSLAGCLLAVWIFYLSYRAWGRAYDRSKLTVGSTIILGGAIYIGSVTILAKSIMA
ncbi:hypothetical protein [Sphingobium sp. WCS2017Hpa-17]|uniref:hypothetical protein n=1 Tax=Sphingobium sp. WCS2017Hpa-17 TaxID=3073638 RepID=UPI00288ADFCC|nr:hypothetical protein [Sphingobium sp. WCS2017Hpa-17]